MMTDTRKAPARLTADALAQQFAEQGRSGCWLTAKQTDFLVNLARQSRGAARYDGMRHTWHGGWSSEGGDAHSWTLYISPLNRCGLFNATVFTRKRAELEDEKRTLEDALRAINEKAMERMHAMDRDGVVAIYEAPENRRVIERLAEVETLLKEGI